MLVPAAVPGQHRKFDGGKLPGAKQTFRTNRRGMRCIPKSSPLDRVCSSLIGMHWSISAIRGSCIIHYILNSWRLLGHRRPSQASVLSRWGRALYSRWCTRRLARIMFDDKPIFLSGVYRPKAALTISAGISLQLTARGSTRHLDLVTQPN